MEAMIKLPDDMFRQEILQYLTVKDIVNLDNACMNHKYRPQLMDKIDGVILLGHKDTSIKASLFKWLGIRRDKGTSIKASLFKWLAMRRVYLRIMMIMVHNLNLTSSSIDNDYVDQFRYTQHVVMRGPIIDDMAIFIISHCPCLLSIDIIDNSRSHQVTDHTLQSIAEHCTRLQSLSLSDCRKITNAGLIIISEHCTGLHSLNLEGCHEISDSSIISISTHCTGLQSLNLESCGQITDVSIISISIYCTGLKSLNLSGCDQITDASIISISENCTGVTSLDVSGNDITDASLIAIAKNCTGLQLLGTCRCNGLSSDKLRHHFKSVSELRAVLLSIYPFLPI
jgi:F-box/leucine-rich repeat protein 2/20